MSKGPVAAKSTFTIYVAIPVTRLPGGPIPIQRINKSKGLYRTTTVSYTIGIRTRHRRKPIHPCLPFRRNISAAGVSISHFYIALTKMLVNSSFLLYAFVRPLNCLGWVFWRGRATTNQE
jgi:hypothetical protein